ncbi:MAG: hypothetical protein K1X53_03895 [Candidatus Sumerlaeaceae bacterium]|nr:hypothetical protein [Candidatus Sumerlaeaceae bacterium]
MADSNGAKGDKSKVANPRKFYGTPEQVASYTDEIVSANSLLFLVQDSATTLTLLTSETTISQAKGSPNKADTERFAVTDDLMGRLCPRVGFWPPRISPRDSKQTADAFARTAEILEKFVSDKTTDWQAAWRYGECMRYAHNLDIPESFESAEHFLLRALEVRPDFAEAQLSLADLYANADSFGQKKEAERLYREVLKSPPSVRHEIAARCGLRLTLLHLSKFSESEAESKKISRLKERIPLNPFTSRLIAGIESLSSRNWPKDGTPFTTVTPSGEDQNTSKPR